MSWDKNPPLEPVFALDTLRNRVNIILKSNQKRTNTQEGDYLIKQVFTNKDGSCGELLLLSSDMELSFDEIATIYPDSQ